MSTSQVIIKDLSITAGKQVILEKVNLTINKGEIISLIGLNGSGKTTLLKAIIGLIKPSQGKISLKAKQIGYVPQRLEIDRTIPITVTELIKTYNPDASVNKILASLDEVDAQNLAKAQIGNLSGGELQRVLIANALIKSPDLLLLDEATAGIDINGADLFYQLIKKIHARYQPTIILVSHDIHAVFSNSDRVYCLNHCICCHGTPRTVYDNPEFKKLFGNYLSPYLHHNHEQHNH